jgi:hypothetical protein
MSTNGEVIYRVLNPTGEATVAAQASLSPRLDDFNEKVIYCISQFVGGADTFITKVKDRLPEFVPGVKTVYRRKPGPYMSDDSELWDEILEKGDAVIYGCGA